MTTPRRASPLLLLLLCLPSLLLSVQASVDDSALFDPVTVAFFSAGVGVDGSEFAGKTDAQLRAEFRSGIVDFLTFAVDGDDGVDAEGNIPLSAVSRTTQGPEGLNGTVWQFAIHYTNLRPNVHTLATYQLFASFCGATTVQGDCMESASYRVEDEPDARRWLRVASRVNLVCCDGVWAQTLQECRDCLGRDFLPLILGLCGGFLALVTLCVCTILYCKRRKEARRIARQSAGAASVADWHGRSVVPQFHAPASSHVVQVKSKAGDTDRGGAKKGRK